MKIAIISFPLRYNYGGIVQAYALQTVLQRMGHDITIIDYEDKCRINWLKFPFSLCKRIIQRYIVGDKECKIFVEKEYNREVNLKNQYIIPFINKNIFNRKFIRSFEKDIKSNEFDGYVVGSDQVWNPGHFTWLFQSSMSNAYLGFAEGWDVKRVAYAVSFGSKNWDYTEEQSASCKSLARYFNGISVREDSGLQLCKQYLNVDAIHVLDPTLLLSKVDYLRLIPSCGVSAHKGQIFKYILDKTTEKESIVNYISAIRHQAVFESNSQVDDLKASIKDRIQPPVEQWLQAFVDADFVVTDSFHGTVFSIIFNKPFISIANYDRGLDRFTSLLKLFHLSNRLISNVNDITDQLISDIDYPCVNTIWDKWKTKSINFLSDSLRLDE